MEGICTPCNTAVVLLPDVSQTTTCPDVEGGLPHIPHLWLPEPALEMVTKEKDAGVAAAMALRGAPMCPGLAPFGTAMPSRYKLAARTLVPRPPVDLQEMRVALTLAANSHEAPITGPNPRGGILFQTRKRLASDVLVEVESASVSRSVDNALLEGDIAAVVRSLVSGDVHPGFTMVSWQARLLAQLSGAIATPEAGGTQLKPWCFVDIMPTNGYVGHKVKIENGIAWQPDALRAALRKANRGG